MGRSDVTVHCQPPRAGCRHSRLALLALVVMHVSSQHTWWGASVPLQLRRSSLGRCVCLLRDCLGHPARCDCLPHLCRPAARGSLPPPACARGPFSQVISTQPGSEGAGLNRRGGKRSPPSLRCGTYTLSISWAKDRIFLNLTVVFYLYVCMEASIEKKWRPGAAVIPRGLYNLLTKGVVSCEGIN